MAAVLYIPAEMRQAAGGGEAAKDLIIRVIDANLGGDLGEEMTDKLIDFLFEEIEKSKLPGIVKWLLRRVKGPLDGIFPGVLRNALIRWIKARSVPT